MCSEFVCVLSACVCIQVSECVCVYTGERMRTSDCVYVSLYAYSGAYEEKAACMWIKKEHMDVYKEKAH